MRVSMRRARLAHDQREPDDGRSPPSEGVAPMVPERPVCKTCGDTHTMRLGEDREVPCTRCPVPCERCRSGAYCATTPCACECHR
jgi:hypothetical protein